MSLEDLYLALGIEAYRAGMITIRGFVSPKKLVDGAKHLFSNSKENFRKQICVDWEYCIKKKQYKAKIEQARAIVLGTSILIPGLPIATGWTISLILITQGLDAFCKCKPPNLGDDGF